MPTLRTGVDLIEVSRVAGALTRHGERFLQRVYTSQEQADCGLRVASLAVRFAAKEAVAKALGCGIGDVAWPEIEVVLDDRRAPSLKLHGAAQALSDRLGVQVWSLSLSHSGEMAVAFVVGLGS